MALTEGELFQILNYDLKNNVRLKRVRDLFCFGCFTGQRFSDIMRFDKQDPSGSRWSFTSYKTKKRVIIPFTGFISNGLQILEKYDYEFPGYFKLEI